MSASVHRQHQGFSRSIALLAVLLTCTGGYVDAIGYLTLGHIYVANMSGNSIAVGIHSAHREQWEVWRFGWPIISYCVGLLLSRFLISWGLDLGWRSVAAPAIAIEAATLSGFMAVPHGPGGVFLAACAMGIQVATVSRFNGVTVYTGFVTGSLVKFAENAADVLARVLRHAPRPNSEKRGSIWFAGIWIAYVSGAALGTLGLDRLGSRAVPAAIAVLVILILVDLIWPAQFEQTVNTSRK